MSFALGKGEDVVGPESPPLGQLDDSSADLLAVKFVAQPNVFLTLFDNEAIRPLQAQLNHPCKYERRERKGEWERKKDEQKEDKGEKRNEEAGRERRSRTRKEEEDDVEEEAVREKMKWTRKNPR